MSLLFLGDPDFVAFLPVITIATEPVNDILFSGYYSFFPWFAFLLIGIFLGRLNLVDSPDKCVVLFFRSLAFFLLLEIVTFSVPELI